MNLETAKKLVLPATLSYAGVRASTLLGSTNTFVQIGAGILGAALGLLIAQKV
jgi:hypothetical protein